MDEFADPGQLRQFGTLLFKKIFNRFNIVIGLFFNHLDSLSVTFGKVFNDCFEPGTGLTTEWRDFCDGRGFCQFL